MDADRRLLIACLDLTSLGDADDDDTIDRVCVRAAAPVPDGDPLHVAAVCVWPRFVPRARARARPAGVLVATAVGGFPVPSAPLPQRLDEIRAAVEAGADEVDVVVNRSLLEEPAALRAELVATREAAGVATWKAILETGVLTPGEIEAVAVAAIAAGADFLKTSTGKGPPGATLEAVGRLARVVVGAARPVGLKVSGGIRTADQALAYLALVREVLGPMWPTPATFRMGASSLLDALVADP